MWKLTQLQHWSSTKDQKVAQVDHMPEQLLSGYSFAATISKKNTTRNSPWHALGNERCTRLAKIRFSCAAVGFGISEVCIWLGPSHRQAKQNGKTLELIGSLTSCGDAQKESKRRRNPSVSSHTVSEINQQSDDALASDMTQPGASTLASLRYACGWVCLTGKQSTMKDSLVDRITYVLWRCTEGVRK